MRLKFVLLLVFGLFLLSGSQALANSPITVSVVDSNGPVGGASVVTLVNGASITGTTGYKGQTTLSLPDGNYSFRALKNGYMANSVYATVGVDGNITIKLDRLFGISGTIVDASTGLPLKDASVTVTDKVTQRYYAGSTDSNGVFTVQVPNGYYSILVRYPNYYPTQRDNNGAGYQVADNEVYVGYIPAAALNSNTGNLEGVQLTADFPGMTVIVNESVSFDVKITNNGVVDKTYELAVKDAPPGWSVKFLSGSGKINRVFVPSKGSLTFQVQTTPQTAGTNMITIRAASGADNNSLQLYVDAADETRYSLELSCPDNITLNVGDTTNLDVLVKNNGSTKLTNVMLDIEPGYVPQSLTASVSTSHIAELDPGETQHITVSVGAKADVGQETDKLYMRATSTETNTNQQYVEVNLIKSNTWITVGIGIALVAILAFGFIVWKYGRR